MKELFIKLQIKTVFFVILFFAYFCSSIQSFENKIRYKINNEIITSLDVEFEKRYLLALNPNLKKFEQNEIKRISENSIINEKIKEQEINKYFQEKKIPQKYLERLLRDIYFKLNISSLDEFKIYVDNKNINYQNIVRKITIEALWNEIILSKFSSKIKIDENVILQEITRNKNKKQKSFLMSEIFFELNKNEKLDEKFEEIKKIIENSGFENAALKFSISQTYNIGGRLDWINENSLNKNIRKKINLTNVGDYTDPIRVATGFLILKINEIKIEKSEIDIKNELKKIKMLKRNNQLNQFSKIYFNKIKKNTLINEV